MTSRGESNAKSDEVIEFSLSPDTTVSIRITPTRIIIGKSKFAPLYNEKKILLNQGRVCLSRDELTFLKDMLVFLHSEP